MPTGSPTRRRRAALRSGSRCRSASATSRSASCSCPTTRSYRRYADLKRAGGGLERRRRARAEPEAEDLVLPGRRLRRLPRLLRPRPMPSAAAAQLRGRGLEVSVYARAGLLDARLASNWLGGDPLLNTFIRYPEGELARLIFHELAHQVAYATRRHRVQRIVRDRGRAHRRRALARRARERRGARRVRALRRAAARLPRADAALPRASSRRCTRATRPTRRSAPRKAALHVASCAPTTRALKAERWGGYAGYDAWFARANNAALGVLARLQRPGAAVRAPVRARGPRLRALLRRGQAPRALAAGRAPRRARGATATAPRRRPRMADIHIRRAHRARPGRRRARSPGTGPSRSRSKFEHGMHRDRGRDQRHRRVHAHRRRRAADRRGRPLRPAGAARLSARRVQRSASRPRSRRTSTRCSAGGGAKKRGEGEEEGDGRRSLASRTIRGPAPRSLQRFDQLDVFLHRLVASSCPSSPFHASHLARPTMSEKPGRLPSASPLRRLLVQRVDLQQGHVVGLLGQALRLRRPLARTAASGRPWASLRG